MSEETSQAAQPSLEPPIANTTTATPPISQPTTTSTHFDANADATTEPAFEILPNGHKRYKKGQDPRLRYQPPYWWPYKTFCKDRWIGRELLEVVSTEFRDRSVEYYRHALESGVTRVNGVVARPDFILRNGDRIDNTVHRHEPPITNDPILVLHKDEEKGYVMVSKPGSVPVHATGRYFRHTVLEIMLSDYGIKCYSVNRLDRLTSGLMILALTGPAARDLSAEFMDRQVRKEYVARVKGRFPEGLVVVDKPLLTVDRQMGLVIVTPEGKESKTLFRLMSYDAKRDQSVVHCRPLTGRTHQIRVHLQYLGHPIANDPLYSHESIWGEKLGQGGVDLVPSDSSLSAQATLDARKGKPGGTREALWWKKQNGKGKKSKGKNGRKAEVDEADEANVGGTGEVDGQGKEGDAEEMVAKVAKVDLNDREYANIDAGSPIRLSQQARDIIAKLRRAKDEQEDWVKWKEVVFTAKAAQDALEADPAPSTPPSNPSSPSNPSDPSAPSAPSADPSSSTPSDPRPAAATIPRLTRSDPRFPRTPTALPSEYTSNLPKPAHLPPGFCEECFVPVADDPDPEGLFIFLHALRYSTPRLGSWSTPLPRWASRDWAVGDQGEGVGGDGGGVGGDWRGWSGDEVPAEFLWEGDEVVEEGGEEGVEDVDGGVKDGAGTQGEKGGQEEQA